MTTFELNAISLNLDDRFATGSDDLQYPASGGDSHLWWDNPDPGGKTIAAMLLLSGANLQDGNNSLRSLIVYGDLVSSS